MSVINSDSVRAGASGAVTAAYTIEQSCRFNDDDTAYLKRTPLVAGNRRTWTWSAWVKRGNISSGAVMHLFNASDASPGGNDDWYYINILTTDEIQTGTWSTVYRKTTAKYRDPGAWYHIVVGFDSTQPVAADRLKLYVNGEQVTVFTTDNAVTQNQEVAVNDTVGHSLGRRQDNNTLHFDGYMADVHFIDGAQLAATSFGETDDQGNWVPIEYPATATTIIPISRGAGTVLGTMTASGGLAAAFDGNTSQAHTAAATLGGTVAYVGKDWGSGVTKSVTKVGLWSGLNYGFEESGSGTESHTMEFELQGSTDNFSSSVVALGDTTFAETGSGGPKYHEISTSDVTSTTAYRYHRVKINVSDDSSQEFVISEIEFYGIGAADGYGTNGFRLDFADSSHFGLDVATTNTAAVSLAFAAQAVNTANQSAYTFSGHAIGTAAAGRVVVVAVSHHGGGGGGAITALTVGGLAATYLVRSAQESNSAVEIWAIPYPTGTTADIIVTLTGGSGSCGIATYAGTNVGGFVDSAISNADPGTGTVLATKGSAIVGVMGATVSSGDTTFTWGELTESHDSTQETGQSDHTGAIKAYASRDLSVDVTCTPDASTNEEAFAIATLSSTTDNSFGDSGLATNDQVTDSPSDSSADDVGNYCTWNSVAGWAAASNRTLADGNLKFDVTGSGWRVAEGTISVSSGKWYWEITRGDTDNDHWIGIHDVKEQMQLKEVSPTSMTSCVLWQASAQDLFDAFGSNDTSWGDTTTSGDIESVALDMDAGKVWFAKNNSWQESGDPAAGSGEAADNVVGNIAPIAGSYGATGTFTANFGQTGFTYTPPSGFKALATFNFDAPAITDPSKYFQVDTFTGTGSELVRTLTDASGSAVAPDLVWIKDRDTAVQHVFTDRVRGATKELNTDGLAVESTVAEGVKSFNASGYTLGTDGNYNTSSSLNVGWCWVMNGAGASNEEGTINTDATSANITAGQTIISYTGNATASQTLGHGLDSAPEFLIFKDRDSADNWTTWHHKLSAPTSKTLNLDNNDTEQSFTVLDGVVPTATLIQITNHNRANKSGSNLMVWGWHGVESYSKFGSYEGNGNADGVFVWTGFRSAYILCKSIDSTSNWYIYDSKRDGYNVDNDALLADTTGAELTADNIDILSNGFKLRIATDPNVAETYIYAAFAEFPFGGDGVAQARAR